MIFYLGQLDFRRTLSWAINSTYNMSMKKASELKDVCEKINNSARGRHLLEEYEKKHKEAEAEKEQLGIILDAIQAAED